MLENIKDIADLKTAIQSIIVKDYGDFKRRALLYINRYMEEHNLAATDKKTFIQMIDKIQFHPNLDIEKTRSWMLEQLRAMKH